MAYYYFESKGQMDRRIENFVLFHTPGEKWPAHNHSEFWTSASNFIQQRIGANAVYRSGTHYL